MHLVELSAVRDPLLLASTVVASSGLPAQGTRARSWRPSSTLPQYRELNREHANLRAAIDYALGLRGNDSAAVAIATSLAMYWRLSGQLREGEHWLNRVLNDVRGRRLRAPGCWPFAVT